MANAELGDVIVRLREQLSTAMLQGAGERLRFELGPVEVTLSVRVTNEGGGHAGVRFWVVDAGVDGKASKETGQQIKLVLHPKDTLAPLRADGSPASALVTGNAAEGEAN